MAEALEAVLAAFQLDGIHVVGYSLGARVALELCARPGQYFPFSCPLCYLNNVCVKDCGL